MLEVIALYRKETTSRNAALMGGLHCKKHNINTFRPVYLTDRLSLRPFYRRAIVIFRFLSLFLFSGVQHLSYYVPYFCVESHRWCNGKRARLKCGRFEFETRSGQTKDYKFVICCFSKTISLLSVASQRL